MQGIDENAQPALGARLFREWARTKAGSDIGTEFDEQSDLVYRKAIECYTIMPVGVQMWQEVVDESVIVRLPDGTTRIDRGDIVTTTIVRQKSTPDPARRSAWHRIGEEEVPDPDPPAHLRLDLEGI